MRNWTLDDIPWHEFDPRAVDPARLRVAKAAALVERNGADYATYLCNVFHDDPAFQEAARRWAEEEVRHGAALGRWAEMADPGFSFADAFRRFADGYRIAVDAPDSVRGSRTGELVARCIVEVGTSSFYTSLARGCDEPVLATICRNIAADELRHFKLFYGHQKRYRDTEGVGRWRRLATALGRIRESGDDELAFAWHCANEPDAAYERRRCTEAYGRHAYRFYRPDIVERSTAMVCKAVGFEPRGAAARVASSLAWRLIRRRAA